MSDAARDSRRLPFAAAVVFVLMHAYLGVHVLRRKIVFADLALAQLSALGATVAFANGYAADERRGIRLRAPLHRDRRGAASRRPAVSRGLSARRLSSASSTSWRPRRRSLVVDRSPQGAEHVKKMLVGSILTVEPADVAKFAALYAAIGLLHWVARRPLLALSSDAPLGGRRRSRGVGMGFRFLPLLRHSS